MQLTSFFLFLIMASRLWAPAAACEGHDEVTNHPTYVSYCAAEIYAANDGAHMPSHAAMELALAGYWALKHQGELSANDKLTVIDFTLPSTEKRLWVFDLDDQQLLFHTYVAHGQGTGRNMARHFSNTPQSHQSSLGFFRTGDTYIGKHGLSLYLDGLEQGINDNARDRYIVIHGADYVSTDFIGTHGRLGRSHGCPALPRELSDPIIETIKGESCLFIYHGALYRTSLRLPAELTQAG